tara:strand:+ start:1679 stop:2527 length:849 start_codon:yes stop_codon:yes gene_type:complete
MKTSLIIPSTEYHFHHMNWILRCYEQGTVKPDEIIVSVSNSHMIPKNDIRLINDKFKKSFDSLKILEHTKPIPEGPNRGEGTLVASNEIITYSDSDDIPHPQRIEIIKYFFSKYDILHLNHTWTYDKNFHNCKFQCDKIKYMESDNIFSLYFPAQKNLEQKDRIRKNRPNPKEVPSRPPGCNPWYGEGPWNWSRESLDKLTYRRSFMITGGSLSILKDVCNKIEWVWKKNIEYDYDFCMDTLFYFNKSMFIECPLIWYNRRHEQLVNFQEKPIDIAEAVWAK